MSALSSISSRSYADALMTRAMAGSVVQTRQNNADVARVTDTERTTPEPSRPQQSQSPSPAATGDAKDSRTSTRSPGELTPAQQDEVRQLQRRDQVVRQHEMAHLAASGGLATSGAIYSFQRGPDGQSYAVGGEVNIDVSPGRTPQETIARARTIIAAALAPADPSGPDRAVAAQARQMQQQAMIEAMKEQQQSQHPGAQRRQEGIGMYRQMAGVDGVSGVDRVAQTAQAGRGSQINAVA